jgi:hypothetical protein
MWGAAAAASMQRLPQSLAAKPLELPGSVAGTTLEPCGPTGLAPTGLLTFRPAGR